MDKLISVLWEIGARIFIAPPPPTLPSLGPGAKLIGIQTAAQAIVAAAVRGSYFLGVKDGLTTGLFVGLVAGLILHRLTKGNPANA